MILPRRACPACHAPPREGCTCQVPPRRFRRRGYSGLYFLSVAVDYDVMTEWGQRLPAILPGGWLALEARGPGRILVVRRDDEALADIASGRPALLPVFPMGRET